MKNFPEMPKRSIELPLGCKDLFDLEAVRNWKPAPHVEWRRGTWDRLAYIEGQLAEMLQPGGKPKVVMVSRSLDRGHIMIILDPDLDASVLFASWHSAAQEQALRQVFEEAGTPSAAEQVGRWKSENSLKYFLPAEPAKAARFIGEVLRAGYGLVERSLINLSYHERKRA
jgi:hypothetical protein